MNDRFSGPKASFLLPAHNDDAKTLMESGTIELDHARSSQVAVRRGMPALTSEGRTAGHVAALVLDGQSGQVTHLVLGRSCQTLEYCLAPIDLIEAVSGEEVLLRIRHPVAARLPPWRGS